MGRTNISHASQLSERRHECFCVGLGCFMIYVLFISEHKDDLSKIVYIMYPLYLHNFPFVIKVCLGFLGNA